MLKDENCLILGYIDIFLISIVVIWFFLKNTIAQLGDAFVLGVSSSLVAAFAMYFIEKKLSEMRNHHMYGKYDKLKYKGYNNSTAILEYESGNKLTLTLKESEENKWVGSVVMSDENNGTVVWRYTEESKFKKNGLKYLSIYNAGEIILLQNLLPLNFIQKDNLISPEFGMEELKRIEE